MVENHDEKLLTDCGSVSVSDVTRNSKKKKSKDNGEGFFLSRRSVMKWICK